MHNSVELWHSNSQILVPDRADKDTQSRLHFYLQWMTRQGRQWYEPALSEYCDWLLNSTTRRSRDGARLRTPLHPNTVTAHLSTIRTRYRRLLHHNPTVAFLAEQLEETPHQLTDILRAIKNDIHPISTPIPKHTTQDYMGRQQLRLTSFEAEALLEQPDDTLIGIRDRALIALLLCTGIRAAEAAALRCDDLRQQYGSQIALRVRHGKGNKQRAVPYGPLDWSLDFVYDWLKPSQIRHGAVFRRIYRNHRKVGKAALTPQTVNNILSKYALIIGGLPRSPTPHDLRRTYAKNCYSAGMDIERIRQNLGHTAIQTTLSYIGALDAAERCPPPIYKRPVRSRQRS